MSKATQEQLINKGHIVRLVNLWRDRSHLNLNQVIARMQARGCDMSRATFENRFIRLDQAPDIPPDMTLAIIAAFSEGLTQHERCTAAEAIELARLTRLPIDQFEALRDFFPAEEFNQAFSRYALIVAAEPGDGPAVAVIIDLKPPVQVSRAGSDRLFPAEFFMPLGAEDTLYVRPGGYAVFFCRESQLFFRVPESSLKSVDCRDENDPRKLGRLEAILPPAGQANPSALATAEAEIRGLALDQAAQSYLLAQLYRGYGRWTAAFETLAPLAEEQGLTSVHLWQQLGDLALENSHYLQAEKYYRAALTLAQTNANVEAQAAAYLGLAVNFFSQGAVGQVQPLYQTLAGLSPESKARGLVKILLTLKQDSGPTGAGRGAGRVNEQALLAYVRSLSEELLRNAAPHLMDSFRQMADLFLARLAAMPKPLTLRPEAMATMGLGSGDVFEMMGLLAATYLTTQTLFDLDSGIDLSAGPLPETLRAQAEHIAQTAVGLPPAQAQAFAEQYTILVSRRRGELGALRK